MDTRKKAFDLYKYISTAFWRSSVADSAFGIRVLMPMGRFARRTLFSPSSKNEVSLVQGQKMRLVSDAKPYNEAEFIYGTYEPGVTSLFEKDIKPGMGVVDGGAHIGYYTLLAARQVGPDGNVYAFEPDPKNFAGLRENIALNQFSQVDVEQLGLSDSVGSAELFQHSSFSGAHSMFRGWPGVTEQSLGIQTTSLDAYFQKRGWPRVDFVKLDIEGAESAVIEGMLGLIDRNPDLRIILEFQPRTLAGAGVEAGAFLQRLENLGFSLWEAVDDPPSLSSLAEDGDERIRHIGGNLYCIPKLRTP